MSTIKGLDSLNKKLSNLKNISPHSLLAGAFVLERYAKENEEAYADTHFLQNSIVSRETETGAEVEAEASYAFYQEFGTSRMEAQPFMRPAIDEHSNDISKAVASQIKKDIAEQVGG